MLEKKTHPKPTISLLKKTKMKRLRFFLIFFLVMGLVFQSSGLSQSRKKIIPRIEKERSEFKYLLLKNLNYFGTFPELKLSPVLPMNMNIKYEEIECIGFYPEKDLLEAIIDVKMPYGYKGNLCTQGSYEYVRFFIDWNGDGDYTDEGEDAGITGVNVHDIPNITNACLPNPKPLSYTVSLEIDPKKRSCVFPRLVKVKAILSWEWQPTAGNPGFNPVWGNAVEKWIQIKPLELSVSDILSMEILKKMKIDASYLNLDIPVSKPKKMSPVELKKIYKEKDVSELRFNFQELYQKAMMVKQDPSLFTEYQLDPKLAEVADYLKKIIFEKPETKYEELKCAGLLYDQDALAATLTVKLPYGYSGNLCSDGSYEYVTFWIYFWDQIEQMCVWRYMGTASVNVHDIPGIPEGGLQYAVKLPADLSAFKDTCNKQKVLKVRTILSWQKPPPINDPNYNPVWGNKIDTQIQIRPGKPIEPGQQIPYISSIGGMAVASISGNADTSLSSTLGDGYANGPSVSGGFYAVDSPFGGKITIAGHISNPPNYSQGASKLKYKVEYKKSTESSWHAITNQFRIWISTWNGTSWSMSPKNQIALGGYYTYEEDTDLPIQHYVEGDVLAQWRIFNLEDDGLYEIRVLLYKLGAPGDPFNNVPVDHISSNVIKVKVDNTPPEANVSLDLGPCTEFEVGDVFNGKFTATDSHIWKYSLWITPSMDNPPTIVPTGETYPSLAAPGKTDEPFSMTTTSTTTPCGYVVNLYVWDRTIRNNRLIGNRKPATVGLCLRKKVRKKK